MYIYIYPNPQFKTDLPHVKLVLMERERINCLRTNITHSLTAVIYGASQFQAFLDNQH